jgi:hypothetical protein
MAKKLEIYPHFEVANNKAPKKYYAFPIGGFLVKVVFLIPVAIELLFLTIAGFFILLINWFIILFTGEYWDTAYRFFLGFMRLETKVALYLYGLTDNYPGFSLNTNGLFKLDIDKPKKPNRWFAIPFFGFIAKFILLLPYMIFCEILSKGAFVGVIISWFAVTFKNKYPESLYEFERDSIRVSNAASAYLLGLKDNYPSFYISLENYQTAKLLLIIAGAFFTFSGGGKSDNSSY